MLSNILSKSWGSAYAGFPNPASPYSLSCQSVTQLIHAGINLIGHPLHLSYPSAVIGYPYFFIGFPIRTFGNDTLTLVIPEYSPLKLAFECFNRVTCRDKHYRGSPNCHTRMPLSGIHFYPGFPIKLVPTCL